MAKKLGRGSVSWRQSANPRIYPWDQWFDGDVWQLTPGEDFDGPLSTFRSYCYRQAREREYRLRTSCRDGYLFIQALAWDGSELGRLDEYGRPINPQNL